MVRYTPTFEKLFAKTLKPYPKSREQVKDFIENDLAAHPDQGDRYPGFGPDTDIRKIRIALAHYKIKKSKGLRLIYLHRPDKPLIIPLFIYLKSTFKAEHKIKAEILRNLKTILSDLTQENRG